MTRSALKIYNTLSHDIEEFKPLKDGIVGIYSCGPTVYNFAHIGNFRSYIFADILRRTLEMTGLKVEQVMNITDVDDKTIANSKKAGLQLREYTKRYTDEFFADLKTLNIEPAEHYPAATDHIPEMTSIIRKLKAQGLTYESGGSVYYSIAKFPEYGKLSGMKLSQNKDGARPTAARADSDEYAKDNAKDFVLWKAKKEGEPSWTTEFGEGRPGWHIECSAMSMKYLGETFDIHTGGNDLVFPHHENEIAQSEGSTGKPFARYWIHCAHLLVEGEKMSKSAGNFFTLRDILQKGYSSQAIRWLLWGTHYRKNLNFTFDGLRNAQTAVDKFQGIYDAAGGSVETGPEDAAFVVKAQELAARFNDALMDDLNVSGALAAVFDFMNEYNRLYYGKNPPAGAKDATLKAMKVFDRVLGVLQDGGKPEEALDEESVALIKKRSEARKNRDWKASDELRDQLKARGILVEDSKNGMKWRRSGPGE